MTIKDLNQRITEVKVEITKTTSNLRKRDLSKCLKKLERQKLIYMEVHYERL